MNGRDLWAIEQMLRGAEGAARELAKRIGRIRERYARVREGMVESDDRKRVRLALLEVTHAQMLLASHAPTADVFVAIRKAKMTLLGGHDAVEHE